MPRLRRLLDTGAVAVAVFVTAACQAQTRSETVSAQARPAASGAVTAPPDQACDFTGTPEPKAGPQEAASALLTDVRVGTHGCYERVVFEVRPRAGEAASPLGWSVRYQPGPITQDGSGDPVAVKGSAFLVVTLQATGVDLSQEGAPETYRGPATIEAAGTSRIVQVRRVGDFEGVSTWVVGLDARRPFRAETVESPGRLVVDVGD